MIMRNENDEISRMTSPSVGVKENQPVTVYDVFSRFDIDLSQNRERLPT